MKSDLLPVTVDGSYIVTEHGNFKSDYPAFDRACTAAQNYSRESNPPFIYSVYELTFIDNTCKWVHRRSWRSGTRIFSTDKLTMAAKA